MHSLTKARHGLFVLALCSLSAAAQEPDFRYKIDLSIGGTPIEGGIQRTQRAMGKPNSQQQVIFTSSIPTLKYGQTVQLSVKVTDPAGKTVDYTGKPQLRYEGFGCITVGATGRASVVSAPTDRCTLDVAQLWIIYEEVGKPPSYNTYMFNLVK